MPAYNDQKILGLVTFMFNEDKDYVEDLLIKEESEDRRVMLACKINIATPGDKSFNDCFQSLLQIVDKRSEKAFCALAKCLRLASSIEECDKLVTIIPHRTRMSDLVVIRAAQILSKKRLSLSA